MPLFALKPLAPRLFLAERACKANLNQALDAAQAFDWLSVLAQDYACPAWKGQP